MAKRRVRLQPDDGLPADPREMYVTASPKLNLHQVAALYAGRGRGYSAPNLKLRATKEGWVKEREQHEERVRQETLARAAVTEAVIREKQLRMYRAAGGVSMRFLELLNDAVKQASKVDPDAAGALRSVVAALRTANVGEMELVDTRTDPFAEFMAAVAKALETQEGA